MICFAREVRGERMVCAERESVEECNPSPTGCLDTLLVERWWLSFKSRRVKTEVSGTESDALTFSDVFNHSYTITYSPLCRPRG